MLCRQIVLANSAASALDLPSIIHHSGPTNCTAVARATCGHEKGPSPGDLQFGRWGDDRGRVDGLGYRRVQQHEHEKTYEEDEHSKEMNDQPGAHLY